MRLTLVIASLGRGGAERTASILAGAWAEQGHHITLITLVQDDVPAFPLHPSVVLRQLRVRGGVAKNIVHSVMRQLRTVRVLRAAIREAAPDFIVSFMDIPNVLTLLAARGLAAPVIITEHVHPAHYRIGWHWEMLRRLTYHRAAALVCVSRPLLDWFQRKIRVRGYVVPNPVTVGPPPAATVLKQNGSRSLHVMVGMGRLVEQKGFDLLLEAFSRIADRHRDWSLKIMGDGPLRDQLETQKRNLNLNGRVEFTGGLPDPFPVLRSADLFVFPSRFEGFGNALCEAMACGLPVISFDCPSGPSDIVRPGVDGLLIPAEDVAALAAAMDRLMTNGQERAAMAARAPEIISRFGVRQVLDMWEKLFNEVQVESNMRTR
ncbi:MAG TPA: glycosyltransferase family 4 protein [Candidatus Angelobacter sp.]|nr:glycosyltransferase family 4 protein [Candidatus Angelobacter sp.]